MSFLDQDDSFDIITFYAFNGRNSISVTKSLTITTQTTHTKEPETNFVREFEIKINKENTMSRRIYNAFAFLVEHYGKEKDAF